MTLILVLRPQPGAERTAARLRALGLTPVVHPLFELRPLDWTMPEGDATALLVTSANAVRLSGPLPDGLTRLPIFAVGPASAAAASEAGLTVAFIGSSDGGEAIRAMAAAGHRTAIHLRGETARALPPDVRLLPLVTYAADPRPDPLPADLSGATALLHSPRAADLFAERVAASGTARADLSIVAISEATARAAGDGWQWVEVAKRPTDGAMVELAARIATDPA